MTVIFKLSTLGILHSEVAVKWDSCRTVKELIIKVECVRLIVQNHTRHKKKLSRVIGVFLKWEGSSSNHDLVYSFGVNPIFQVFGND